MKSKKKIIIVSIIALLAAGSFVGGVTYALFKTNSQVNIAVTSGNIDVKASVVDGLTLTHQEWDSTTSSYVEKDGFYNGEATLDEAKHTLSLSKMLPMDKVSFKIKITNNSNVTVKYRTVVKTLEDTGLFEGLKVTIDDEEFDGIEARSDYSTWSETGERIINVSIEIPEDTTVDYSSKSCTISYLVDAVQGNARAEKYDVVYPLGVNKSTFPDGKPIVYENSDGVATYVEDVPTAVSAGASVIYAQEDSTIADGSTLSRTNDIQGDFTIYGNRANFNHTELALNQSNKFSYNVNLMVYNAKNIYIWGCSPLESGYTYNLSMYGCSNNYGGSAISTAGRMIYVAGTTGTVNETLVDSTFENGDLAMYSKADGKYTIKNCAFSNSVTPIKFSHKSTGTAYVNITNTTFDKCGYSEDMGTYADSGDAAAIKLKSNSSMVVKFKNVAITKMVGSAKAIWLNLDNNSKNNSITGSATNVTVEGDEWTFPTTTPVE